ncbi:MAG: TSUP family transporter [Candidatus Riflebacteria bacterium]|nr:TSUP family transporter [Candidatus Riflebacteria bacterium]
METLILLFAAALVAGFVDTLAGGGGLITIPALVLSGMPPHFALGTNKLQSSIGSGTATFMMFKKGRVGWQHVRFLMLAAFCGSLLGTIAVQFINPGVLDFIIPGVLIVIAIYFLFAPPLHETGISKVSETSYRHFMVPVIGWYDGMFGPGTGSFFALAGVSLRGHGLIDATAIAKTLNFATNIASLLIFLIAGKVVWLAGLAMMVGQFVGAYCGSLCLLRINPKYLRVLVVTMCLAMLARYVIASGWFSKIAF